jgi:DNA polymerase-3 subunit alpha
MFTKMSFVHLHCHSEYSLLDGANRIEDLIRRAQEFEQPALAITDHGNLHAAWEFQEKAKKAGVKPIIGMEVYVAPGDRRSRTRARQAPKSIPPRPPRRGGLRNLVKLSSLAYTEGLSKPRVDRELLALHSEGIVVSLACLAGGRAAPDARPMDEARGGILVRGFVQGPLLPRGRRISPRPGGADTKMSARQRPFAVSATTMRISSSARITMRTTCCLHRPRKRPERRRSDEVRPWPVLQERARNRRAFSRPPGRSREYSQDRRRRLGGVRQEIPLAGVSSSGRRLDGRRAAHHPRHSGRERGYGFGARGRTDYELGVITNRIRGYFDFIMWARDRGIPVGPGRGSAAGSLVAYSLRITDVDPLKYDLLFERFLNPERVSMPDVDVDFCFERRGEVIEYVRQKYGRQSVCQIVTFGTMKSRAAIKDVGRTLGFSPAETDSLAKLIPNQPNFSLTVKEAVDQIGDVGKLYRNDDRYRQLLDYAIALEGLSRHTGSTRPALIAPGPLDDYVLAPVVEGRGSERRRIPGS